MGDQVFKGKSTDAEAPFLSTDFWKDGARIAGLIERVFKIDGRNNYAMRLTKAVSVEGELSEVVSVGESAGIRMAMQSARLRELRQGDQVVLICIGETASKKAGNSPRKDFQIEVTRPQAEDLPPEEYR
jgi:hypothetical protein